jgi:MEDS: MEthanogen/methylotroph, DcmR Sensory domain
MVQVTLLEDVGLPLRVSAHAGTDLQRLALPERSPTMSHRRQVRLAGSVLDRSRHVCAFFHGKEEEYRVLLPFIKEGFDQGDRVFHIVSSRHRAEHLRRLQEVGIPVTEAERKGQLEVRRWEEAHLRDGRFDQHRMLAFLEQALTEGKAQGFPLTRLMANMEWGLEEVPGLENFLEFETRVNYLTPKYDDVLCCIYDLTQFGGSLVMNILRTHPMVIIGGVLHENPFFVPPDEFLCELRERAQKSIAVS